MLPSVPAITDPASTASFAVAAVPAGSARSAMRSATVSPTPQRQAAPTSCRAVTPSSAIATRETRARPDAQTMPSGFPTTSPRTIPQKTGPASWAEKSTAMRTPVAEKAKAGRTAHALHGARACSTRSAGEESRSLAAERFRAAHSQTGSAWIRASRRESSRASVYGSDRPRCRASAASSARCVSWARRPARRTMRARS